MTLSRFGIECSKIWINGCRRGGMDTATTLTSFISPFPIPLLMRLRPQMWGKTHCCGCALSIVHDRLWMRHPNVNYGDLFHLGIDNVGPPDTVKNRHFQISTRGTLAECSTSNLNRSSKNSCMGGVVDFAIRIRYVGWCECDLPLLDLREVNEQSAGFGLLIYFIPRLPRSVGYC